jgi:hypothetical protein
MTPSRASQAAAIGNMTIPWIAEGIAIAVLSRTVSATAMANVLLWMPISKPLARTRSPARRGIPAAKAGYAGVPAMIAPVAAITAINGWFAANPAPQTSRHPSRAHNDRRTM